MPSSDKGLIQKGQPLEDLRMTVCQNENISSERGILKRNNAIFYLSDIIGPPQKNTNPFKLVGFITGSLGKLVIFPSQLVCQAFPVGK